MSKFTKIIDKTIMEHSNLTIPQEICKGWGDEWLIPAKLKFNLKSDTFGVNNNEYYIRFHGIAASLKDQILKDKNYRAFMLQISNVIPVFDIIFSHTRMLLEDKDAYDKIVVKKADGSQIESMEIEFNDDINDPIFTIVDVKVVTNFYTEYFKKQAERKNIRLNTKYDQDLKHLIDYSSPWHPISELEHHKCKDCIYMWVDDINKLIYIGKADSLVKRIKQEIDYPTKNPEECLIKYNCIYQITRFRYDVLSPAASNDLIFAIEMRTIRSVAAFFPNYSRGELQPAFDLSDYTMINLNYNYH